MGVWAEGPACADTGSETPIGASGNFPEVVTSNRFKTLTDNESDPADSEVNLDESNKHSENKIEKILSFGAGSCIDIMPEDKINKSVQTIDSTFVTEESENDFLPYKCFYCRMFITSKGELENHKEFCQEAGLVTNLNNSVFDDIKHLDMNEELESYLHHVQTIAARVFKCDICHETFQSEMLFGMHNVFTHSRLGWAQPCLLKKGRKEELN